MTTAPQRTRSGNLPAIRHVLLTLALIAGSAGAIAFTAFYAWSELQRIAAAFGFGL